MKVSCLNKISKVGLNLLPENYEIVDAEDTKVDAILVRSAAMHDMELDPQVLAVARAGAGVNNIPLDKFAEKGVVVFNTPGANANAVKELVISSLLTASRNVIAANKWVIDNKDDANIAKTQEKAKAQFAGTEIMGKTIGVIGLGAIGVLVANACISLGMDVIGYDPYLSVENARNLDHNVKYTVSLDDIYAASDYITIHVPLLDSTRGMINKESIAKMKDGVVLLNYARDVLANEADVKEALEAGKVKAYMTDFANPTSVTMKNAIVTPHLGASTEEAEDNCAKMAVNEIVDFIENGNIKNSVNYPACSLGVCKTEGRVSVCHKNIAGLINKMTELFASKNINICDMVSKSRGDYAYTIFDIDGKVTSVETLTNTEGVLRARIIK